MDELKQSFEYASSKTLPISHKDRCRDYNTRLGYGFLGPDRWQGLEVLFKLLVHRPLPD